MEWTVGGQIRIGKSLSKAHRNSFAEEPTFDPSEELELSSRWVVFSAIKIQSFSIINLQFDSQTLIRGHSRRFAVSESMLRFATTSRIQSMGIITHWQIL